MNFQTWQMQWNDDAEEENPEGEEGAKEVEPPEWMEPPVSTPDCTAQPAECTCRFCRSGMSTAMPQHGQSSHVHSHMTNMSIHVPEVRHLTA
eukprot:1578071-Amphidinium_carterae.1